MAALLEANATAAHRSEWESDEDLCLCEVVQRMDGVEGLGRLARSTGRAHDPRAWCDAPVESKDWKAALAAYDEPAEILQVAGVQRITDARVRKAVLEAMPEAAEKRVAGVTDSRRHRHYAHAARRVATCEAIDPAPAWVAGLRARYRRFSALQRELDEHGDA